ncbi:MAG: nuclear transport factor 2 family protein [Ramlibacter sp.]|nr:nuclear transport factor 2 family protein [Ramlibacter sp.]MBX3657028.1 nuclear transport factor 2 family protein [Ramlibacter sp.]
MYHAIVRRKLRNAFAAINAGAYEGIVAQFAPRHRHVMYGHHALAGERRTAASTAAWYARLQRLMPDLRFDVGTIAVTGWPWHTVATVTWTDQFGLPDGGRGSNQGVHEFVLRWGRVHGLAVHCDTARLQAYCDRMARAGLAEAAAPPITDTPLNASA